ncbi:MAG: alpha-hydroxy-acid oxidizing protein [Microthrixaceae bacterium]
MSEVEIGPGKRARRGYRLDEVSIVPTRRTRDADDVDLRWRLDAFTFGSPFVVDGDARAVEGLSVLDSAAFFSPERVLDRESLSVALARQREQHGTVALSVRPQRAEQLIGVLNRLDVDLLIIRGRVVSAEHASRTREPLNLKQVVRRMETPVIVGGCSSFTGALHLMRTGAAGVIVSSHHRTHGVGVPLATAIAEAAAARLRHLDETGVYVHVIADLESCEGGDAAKAVVCGADAVMVDPTAGGDRSSGLDDALTAMAAGLRRSMASCGYENAKRFQLADLVVLR